MNEKNLSRRAFAQSAALVSVLGCASTQRTKSTSKSSALPPKQDAIPPQNSNTELHRELRKMETTSGGRIGTYAVLRAASGAEKSVGFRQDERFSMCSTFKWALAASLLVRTQRGEFSLKEPLALHQSDLQDYAPIARALVDRGVMTVEEAARASVTHSDNTAANLLLRRLGGPAALTQFFAEELGDSVTRLDREEPWLNENREDDERDTTTPFAMTSSLSHTLSFGILADRERDLLFDWMHTSQTGRERLRAVMPRGWTCGDKTGTGQNGACNDVLFARSSDGSTLTLSCYLSGSTETVEEMAATHRAVAQLVLSHFALL